MNRLWHIAGALCLAHVVLLLAGYTQQSSPVFGATSPDIVSTYAAVPAVKMYTGGYIGTLARLALIAAVTLLARLLRGSTETSGWLAGLVGAAGITAATVTLGAAFATAGASFYGATHGWAPDIVASMHTASKFADIVTMMALGLLALAVGAAGLTCRALPRWIGWVADRTQVAIRARDGRT